MTGKHGVVEAFADTTKVLGLLATLGALLELLGVTDAFNFDQKIKEEIKLIKNQILINDFASREERASSLLGGIENVLRDLLQNLSGVPYEAFRQGRD